MAERDRRRSGFSFLLFACLIHGVLVFALARVTSADADIKIDCSKYGDGSGSGSGAHPTDDFDYGNIDDEDTKVTRCQAGAKDCYDNLVTDAERSRYCKDQLLKAGGIAMAPLSGDRNGLLHPKASQTPMPATSETPSAVHLGYTSTWHNPAIIAAICLAAFFGIIAAILAVVVAIHYRKHSRKRLLSESVYV